MTFKGYFGQLIETTEVEQDVAAKVRAIAKWLLEFARNLIVVSLLVALALRSKSLGMAIFAAVMMGALVMYLMSYMNSITINLFPFPPSPYGWLNRTLFILASAFLYGSANYFAIYSILSLMTKMTP